MMTLDESTDFVTETQRPGLVSRTLHWLIALLVIFQGLLGYADLHVGWFLNHEAAAVGAHQEVGLVILVLTVWMLALRWFEGRRSGHGLNTVHARLAGAVHAALYLLILAESFLGIWIMGLLGGGLSLIFWHINLPIAPHPSLVFGWVMQLHAAIAGALATAIVGHALAALYHHFVLDDDVLRRMLPWKSRVSGAMATPVLVGSGAKR